MSAVKLAVAKAASLMDAFKSHEDFCRCLLDAWALVTSDCRVLKCNQLFAQLVGESTRKVMRAQSLDELIKLQVGGNPLSAAEILDFEHPRRIDEVSGDSKRGSNLTLIISIYPINRSGQKDQQGVFLLLRDVTDDRKLHDKYKTTKTDAITDQLTGLFTRRYFEDYLESQSIVAMKNKGDLDMALLMVDIDFFKSVNDDYGHQAGDAVLRGVGELITQTFRKSDITSRYGGEEFLLVLPHTGLKGAKVAAESLRKKVEQQRFIFDSETITVTVSIGIAQIDFNQESYMDTLARADAALYKAKQEGRNQIWVHNGPGAQDDQRFMSKLAKRS